MQIWYRWLLKYGREFIWGILITKTILAIILLSNLHMIKIEPNRIITYGTKIPIEPVKIAVKSKHTEIVPIKNAPRTFDNFAIELNGQQFRRLMK